MINKILLVDDESSFISGFSRALNRVCHFNGEIKTSANGTDAIHEICRNHFDVCFLDVNLPDISGLEVMKKIKEVSPETRVIIMTGSVLDDEMKGDIDRDAYMFIPKPIELDVIKSILKKGIDANGGPSPCKSVRGEEIEEKRKHPRMPCSKVVHYSVSIFYDWELRSGLVADIIDISEGGIGIRTSFPVSVGNVLRFEEDFQKRKGIVTWAEKNAYKYRSGVKYL